MNDAIAAMFDWRTAPLDGRMLIEASAGTGKTFNIGLLFLRLLLERELPVEKLLVVTFTEAAAQELRERLRRRLVDAERGLQGLGAADDELTVWLAARFSGAAAQRALRQVRLARFDIDRAPIATIHAVCQRILREHPLEAGGGFGVDLLLEETALLRECVEDFWRRRYLGTTAAVDEDAVVAKGPEALLHEVRELLAVHATMLPLAACAEPSRRVLSEACAHCRSELPRRARRHGGRTYSMLIDDVYERVTKSTEFADALFAAFPAALIDEFQDTDRRQFEIFDRIYRDRRGAPRGLMAMIGDPKQAIYAFRGGDIAAYLAAREQAAVRFSLAVNYRSSTPLVEACNALYAHADGGFDDARVHYRRVTAAGEADANPHVHTGGRTPLLIHRFRGSAVDTKGARLESLGKLEALALRDCAEAIVELLNDTGARIGDERVAPGHIAVLLPQNRQVMELRAMLRARRVPCVGSGRGSVFDTDVARELELVLHGVLEGADESAVRGALTTRLLGRTHADLERWQEDDAEFERELERFAAWRARARSGGVLAVVAELLAARATALLMLPDGERLLTDLRHLGELLAEQESSRGVDGVFAWFAALRREGADEDIDAAEARQLRIESDAKRVQLMTLHAAKGLEFPIVFLPLAWRVADRGGPRQPTIRRFHDDAGNACVDIGSTDFAANLARHHREDLQERLRLLYVALTRAIHAVHVYWVDRASAATAGEAWQVPAIDVLIRSAQRAQGLPVGEDALDEMARRLGGIGVVEPHPRSPATYAGAMTESAPRAARTPLPQLRPFLWLHSFSSLTRHALIEQEPDAADETESGAIPQEQVPGPDDPRLLALDAWRGRHFGDAVHRTLEAMPCGPVDRDWLAARFAAQGLHPITDPSGDAIEAVAGLIDRARESDLGDGLRLRELSADARVAEFEFQFPVDADIQRLRAICARHGRADVVPANLSVPSLRGMLTGFADLIFGYQGRYHVLDYKTNRLGLRLADYDAAALDAAMSAHHYDLQALLYSVALHRYLRQRLPGYAAQRHLGESWYLFLRAVGLMPGLGVWRCRWPAELIEELDSAFAGVAEATA